jgi:ABC-type nitrate/sulfonate/bicarbonate transport system substrate-binding protein
MDNVISWSRDTGSPFRVVAQIERTTQLELFGREPFRQLESLRGARLAVDAPDSGFVLVLRGALDAAGVGPRDYSLVPCGGVKERLDALLAGTADAGLLGPPLTAVAAKAGLYRIANIESVFPDYPGLGAVICQDRSQAIRLALSAYVSALEESLEWMRDRPAELAAALAEANFPHESIDRVLETRPDTLCPSLPGLQRILSLRQRYDPQFDFRTMPDDLLDSSLLAA